MMPTVDDILQLFELRGESQYGGESVSQLEHALQAALLAQDEQAPPALIVAALLHDIGHLLHDLPVDAPDRGHDDRHEDSGDHYLRDLLPLAATEPLRLHVEAKRYLCAIEPGYLEQLSRPSVVSLNLQGGPMTSEEVDRFRMLAFSEDAVRLRRWDDAAKIPALPTPPLSHFAVFLRDVARQDSAQ